MFYFMKHNFLLKSILGNPELQLHYPTSLRQIFGFTPEIQTFQEA